MSKKLVRHRQLAFSHQSGLCYYCNFPMWQKNPELYAHALGFSLPQAKWHQCTAEHLEPRKDGGKDVQQNIVAACRWCNQKRHSRKLVPSPRAYQQFVNQRLSKGRWHSKTVAKRLLH